MTIQPAKKNSFLKPILKLSAIALAAQLCCPCVNALAITKTSAPQKTTNPTITNNSKCFIESKKGEKIVLPSDGSYNDKTYIRSGQTIGINQLKSIHNVLLTSKIISKDKNIQHLWFAHCTPVTWAQDSETQNFVGKTLEKITKSLTISVNNNNVASIKTSTPGTTSKNLLRNHCLVYTGLYQLPEKPTGNYHLNMSFTNVCANKLNVSQIALAPADGNPFESDAFTAKNTNANMPSWIAASKVFEPHKSVGQENEKSGAKKMFYFNYPKDGDPSVQTTGISINPGQSFSVGFYGADKINDSGAKKFAENYAGNMYAYTNTVITSKNIAKIYPSYDDDTYPTVDNPMSSTVYITTGKNSSTPSAFPFTLGSTKKDPEEIQLSDKATSYYVKAIPLTSPKGSSSKTFLVQKNIAQANNNPGAQELHLSKVAANKTKTLYVHIDPINPMEAKDVPNLKTMLESENFSPPSATINVIPEISNKQIVNQSATKKLEVKDSEFGQLSSNFTSLLPNENYTITPTNGYYSDAIKGVFYTFVPKDSTITSESTQPFPNTGVLGYTTTKNVGQQYKLTINMKNLDLGKAQQKIIMDNLVIQSSNTGYPGAIVKTKVSDIKNNTFYARGEKNGKNNYFTVTYNGLKGNNKLIPLNNKIYSMSTSTSNGTLTVTIDNYKPVFAPYDDVSAMSAPDISKNSDYGKQVKNAGITIAFVQAAGAGCEGSVAGYDMFSKTDSWSNGVDTTKPAFAETLKESGRPFYLSFGGAVGSMLSAVCPDVDSIVKQYDSYYNKLSGPNSNFKGLDFDVEGSAISDSSVNEKLPLALAKFHAEHPEAEIWLTLPAGPYGLSSPGIAFAQKVIDKLQSGLTGINLMTMDYGLYDLKGYQGKNMGELAESAGDSLATQLATLYKTQPNADQKLIFNAMVGNTPMIGYNDNYDESNPQQTDFKKTDAINLNSYAKKKNWSLRFWSINRDKPCQGSNTGRSICSENLASPWDFTKALGGSGNEPGPNPPVPPAPIQKGTAITLDLTNNKNLTQLTKQIVKSNNINFYIKEGDNGRSYNITDSKDTINTTLQNMKYKMKSNEALCSGDNKLALWSSEMTPTQIPDATVSCGTNNSINISFTKPGPNPPAPPKPPTTNCPLWQQSALNTYGQGTCVTSPVNKKQYNCTGTKYGAAGTGWCRQPENEPGDLDNSWMWGRCWEQRKDNS